MITINQQPTFPNGTQSDMIYVITGSFVDAPQHRYLCRISSGSEILSTVKQVANASGIGVFEVSRLLDDHMGFDSPWLISGSSPFISSSNNNIATFEIAFAEEYGTSLTSSLTTTGYFSGSNQEDNQVIPAAVDRDSGDFNWSSGSYFGLTNNPNYQVAVNDKTIVNALEVYRNDYLTISSLNNQNFPKGFIDTVSYKIYNTSYTNVYTETVSQPYAGVTLPTQLAHIGVGPKNIEDINGGSLGTYLNDPTNYPYYSVSFNNIAGTSSISSDEYLFKLACEYHEGANFAFINKLGVYDYYRATMTTTERESFSRETYRQGYVNYSTTSPTIDYDYARRGETQYLNQFANNFTAETNWLTTNQATWLFELFESPSVFVQVDSHFEPIIITNAEEQYRTNVAGQRMFKFTIQYRKANAKHSRY